MNLRKLFLWLFVISILLVYAAFTEAENKLKLVLEVKRIAEFPYLPIELGVNFINNSSQRYLKFLKYLAGTKAQSFC